MRSTAISKVLVGGLALTALAAGAAGCSSGGTTTAPTSSTTTSILPPAITTPTVVINGKSFTTPTESPGHAVPPYVGSGGQIIISTKGVLPYHLFAGLGQKITFTNLTPKPVVIKTKFHSYFTTGEIPVGGTFSWSSPTSVSLGYTTSNGFNGVIAVGAFQ